MARFWEWLFNKIAAGEFNRLYELLEALRDEVAKLRKAFEDASR
jgi:hypothetical protein